MSSRLETAAGVEPAYAFAYLRRVVPDPLGYAVI